MQPNNLPNVILAGALLLFSALSIWLAPYNFDLHHDGYALTQSWLGLSIDPETGKPFQQYGAFYHYILGLLLYLGDGSPIISRYAGICIILLTSILLFAGTKQHRTGVSIVLGIWLSQCYWATPHLQFFVQFHPSQLGLLFFAFNYFLISDLTADSRTTNQRILWLALSCVLCLFSKLNFGLLLFPVTLGAILVKRPSVAMRFAIASGLLLAIGVTAISDTFSDTQELLRFGVNTDHVKHVGVVQGVENTFWLNPEHGSVHEIYRILFILPSIFILWWLSTFTGIKQKLRMPLDLELFTCAKDNRVLVIMALALWCTLFPTGSFQHLWYGSPLALIFAAIVMSTFLQPTMIWIVTSLVIFGAFQNFVAGFTGKLVYSNDYKRADIGLLEGLKLSPSVIDYLTEIQRISEIGTMHAPLENVCKTLNLTVNGIHVRDPETFCSIDSGVRNFSWASEMRLPYHQFEKRLLSWQGAVISPTPDLISFMRPVSNITVHGQDFGTENYFFISQPNNPENASQAVYSAEGKETSFMSVKEWRMAVVDHHMSNASIPDSKVFFTGECDLLERVMTQHPSLPMTVAPDGKACRFVSNQTGRTSAREIAISLTYIWITLPKLRKALDDGL